MTRWTGHITSALVRRTGMHACTSGGVVGPSAIAWDRKMWVDGKGQIPVPTAHALTAEEVEQTIETYVHSAALAIEAGFDRVELPGGTATSSKSRSARRRRSAGTGSASASRLTATISVFGGQGQDGDA